MLRSLKLLLNVGGFCTKKFLCTLLIFATTSSPLLVFAETTVDQNSLTATTDEVSITPREEGSFVVTNRNGAYLRTAPVPSYTPVALYPVGTKLYRVTPEKLSYNGNWWYYVVSSSGQYGYVYASDGVTL